MPHDRKYKTKNTNYRPGNPFSRNQAERYAGGGHPSSGHLLDYSGETVVNVNDEMAYNKRRKLSMLGKKLKNKLAKGLPSTR